jgi:hypothetical protein
MQPTRGLSEYSSRFYDDGAKCGYSARNSREIEAFARKKSDGGEDGDDVIYHFVFLACHSERPFSPQMIDIKGNFICFNYAGLSSFGSEKSVMLSPSMLKNNFFRKFDTVRKPIDKSIFYHEILVPFKEEHLASGSPISLYRSNEGYQIADLHVLCNGEVFPDEMSMFTRSHLAENPGSLYMLSYDSHGLFVGHADLLAPDRLAMLQQAGIDIIDNFRSGRCVPVQDPATGKIVLSMNPYEVRTGAVDARGNSVYRPLLLSEVFNIIAHAIHPYYYNPRFNPRKPDGNPEMTIDEYMKKHLVLVTNGCRCIEGDPPILGRTASTGDPSSRKFDMMPRGGKTRTKHRHNHRRKSVRNDKNKNKNRNKNKKKTRHARTY